jgi:hypothetical protein
MALFLKSLPQAAPRPTRDPVPLAQGTAERGRAVYREHWVDLASGVVAISASGITLSTASDDDDERVDEDADAATDEG